MSRKLLRLLASLTLIALGASLMLVQTDREFINLTPSPSQFVTVEHGSTYAQSFPATRTSISRLGLYLRPVGDLPAAAVQLAIARAGQLASTQTIPTSVIDRDSVNQVRFAEPIKVTPGDVITITLTIPPELTGRIRVLQRTPDETFDQRYATFTINGQPQASPLAYQVYYHFRPPLAIQIGGLLWLIAILTLRNQPLHHLSNLALIAATLAVLATAPTWLLGHVALGLIVTNLGVFLLLAWWLRRHTLTTPAILLGAAILTYSSYWSLHASSEWKWNEPLTQTTASIRDIFLDANQVPSSNGGNWEHFGSYLGILATIPITLGLFFGARTGPATRRLYVQALVILAAGILLTWCIYPIPDAVIVVTLGLAILAALGLEWIMNFLGRDKLTLALGYVIVILITLDLLHVSAASQEFGLL